MFSLFLKQKGICNMDDNFSPRVKDVIAFSKEEAIKR
jgi:hypothetical protein